MLGVVALVGAFVDRLLHLHGAVALSIVFALPALESSAFVGFVFPGEIAVILGGVLASRGNFPVELAAAVAIAGAFAGDSVGYAIGRRYGRGILKGSVGRLPFVRHRLDAELGKAEAFLLRRGAWAVIIGRLTAALRVLVPGLAGIARMPYGRFVAANLVGAVLWGIGFTMAGYAAGVHWERVQNVAGTAGLIAMGVVIVTFFTTRIVLGARHRRRLRTLPGQSPSDEPPKIKLPEHVEPVELPEAVDADRRASRG